MPDYTLNVTLRMTDRGEPIDVTTSKKMRADSEHLARRKIMENYLKHGYQIVKIKTPEEKNND